MFTPNPKRYYRTFECRNEKKPRPTSAIVREIREKSTVSAMAECQGRQTAKVADENSENCGGSFKLWSVRKFSVREDIPWEWREREVQTVIR